MYVLRSEFSGTGIYIYIHISVSVNASLFFTERKYNFQILPKMDYNLVDEGVSFEFRCVYGKGFTKIEWVRRREIGSKEISVNIPRNLITVQTDDIKSVEVYSIKKVTVNDSGAYKCQVTEKGDRRSTKIAVLKVRGKK